MKHNFAILILVSLTLSLSAQKSKVMAVKQMIDAGKFDEAKEAIDLAVENPKTSDWPRTYYNKGLLCQLAYEHGIEKNDSKKTTLYPDQLFVAYSSYEKALELDSKKRLHNNIRQHYYTLANDFTSLGKRQYTGKDYEGALRSFEHAILIGQSELISAKTDTSLFYNAAIAAYEGQNWEKASSYLTVLHEASHSPSSSILLSKAYLNAGDSLMSEEIMMHSLEQYQYKDTLVMYVVNHLVGTESMNTAITVLDKSIEAVPDNYRFLWARALVYVELNQYEEAIASFLLATELSENNPELYYHLGVCYYNIGIEQRQSALNISQNVSYQEARKLYLETFRKAVHWFERSYELDPLNENTVNRLQQLYYRLRMKEKQHSLEQDSK
jgi:tetratricopeptide (TPR) repeat protein